MPQLKLFKKPTTYKDREGKEVKGMNFYLMCGDQLIGINATNYSTKDKQDKGYTARKAILNAFAELLPVDENE